MSQVRLNQRRLSNLQYVDTARELVIHTIKYAKKFPKSAMFLIVKDLVGVAREVYKEVVKVDSCPPKTKEAVDFRWLHLLEAKGAVDSLDGLLSISKEIFEPAISDFGWIRWGELIIKERELIKVVLSKDRKLNFS